MVTWNAVVNHMEDASEDDERYLFGLQRDLVATAKSSANTGAPGLSLHANFSEANRSAARASGEPLSYGGFIREKVPGNEEGTFYMGGE